MLSKAQKEKRSTLVIWLVFAVEMIAIGIIMVTIVNMRQAELKAIPEQSAQVEIVEKGTQRSVEGLQYYARIRFKDGIKKVFVVDKAAYESMQENQTGTLFYKERQPNRNQDDRVFIRFEQAQQA